MFGARRRAVLLLSLVLTTTALVTLSAPASAGTTAGGGFSSSFAGESVFTRIAPGDTGQFSAIFFNDGTQFWTPGAVGLLVCAADKVTCNVPANAAYNRGWFSATVYATLSTVVAPGQNGFFVYNFVVPDGTPPGTATAFYGDVGIIASGALLRPQGYFQVNTTPFVTAALTPAAASVAVGGLQQFTLTSVGADAGVSWSVTGGCGAVTQTGLFAGTAMNSSSQPCAVVATVGLAHARAQVTVYGAPTQLTCAITPSQIAADGGTATNGTATARVSLKDSNGNLVTNASSPSITIINITPGLALMSPLGSVAPTLGIATIAITSTNAAGDIQVSASSGSLTGCNAIVHSVGPGGPAKTVATFGATDLVADGVSTTTLQIDVTDATGVRIGTDNLTQISITLTSGAPTCTLVGISIGTNGALASANAVATVVQGRVIFVVQTTTTTGQCVITIQPNNTSITGGTATLRTRTGGGATRLMVVGNDTPHPAAVIGSCGTVGANSDVSCTTIIIGIVDQSGAVVTGDSGRVVLGTPDLGTCAGAGGGDVVLRSSTTTLGGRATFAFSSGGAYVSCAISFTSSTLVSVNTLTSWSSAGADHLGCSFLPTSLPATGSAVAQAALTVRDVRGNVVPIGTYPVTLSRVSGAVTGLASSTVQYTTAGTAIFTVVTRSAGAGVDTYLPSLLGGTLPGGATSCTIVVQ